jgi:hypothetical protein
MNERIQELYDQAIILEGNGDYVAGELDPVKFAELIVRECILELGISKKCDPYTGELFVCEHNAVLDEQIDMLKEIFGVEK